MAGLHYNKALSTASQAALAPGAGDEDEKPHPPLLLKWPATAGLIIVYFLAGKSGLLFATIQPNTSVIWPATGIALAALLLFGYRAWPAIFVSAFLVNATTAGSIATSLGIAAGNTLEASAGAYLVNRFANGPGAFHRALDVFKFIALAAMASTVASATIGVTTLSLGGYAPWSHYGRIWFTWWLGDAAGDLVFAPLVLLWATNPSPGWDRAQLCEAGLLFSSLMLVGAMVFGGALPAEIRRQPIDFLCIPFLIWVAFRFGPRETATANFVLSVTAIAGTHYGLGPFAAGGPGTSMLLLQSFLSVMCLSLVIAAGVAQRRSADEAHAGLAAIVDSSEDAIIGKSLDGQITSWNASAERLLGYSMAEAVGQPIGMIIPSDRVEEEAAVFERLRRGERVEVAETARLHKDGGRVDISLAVSPIKDAGGHVIGASSIARDISEHKRVMEALRASEEKFHQMADTVPDILYTSDPQGVIEYTNKRFYEYTGTSEGMAEQFRWASAIHPDDLQAAARQWPRLVGEGQPFKIEFRLRTADGSYRWFMAQAHPIRDGRGRVVKWFGSATEIEEQKRAQQERDKLLSATQAARVQAEAAASKLRRLQSVTDSALPELTLDQMLHELLDRLRAAVQGDTATVLLLEPGGRELMPVASVGLEEEIGAGVRIPPGMGIAGRIASSNGGMIFNDLTGVEVVSPLVRRRIKSLVGAPLKIEESVIGVIHVGSETPREFTEEHLDLIRLVAHRAALAIERTRLHENERAARAAAEEANRAKDEFLAMLGHELRNPLGAIVSAMEIVEHFGADAQGSLRARQIMSRQLKHLVRLVDDLLDVARVTTGKIELHRQPVDIAENLKSCVNALGERLSAYDVKMEAQPAWVDGDPTRLEQVCANLLRNALEYTPIGGRIRVSVKPEGADAVVRVEDNGVGISAELLPRVFDLFVQDKRGLDRSSGGLGIGLTLTRRLVELHGGTVVATSAGAGLGSVFTVRLPRLAAPPPKPQSGGVTDRTAVRRRVLIV
ncbi:MAG TPA: PAS domain S-box protein, partial [Candidatus Binataceae bacterium]